ncbi:uncharacterized protein Nmlp_3343 [Natronomonas moolapensis 8.8.11]|uniref:Uncharacterized protein n=1 Tax=Natronomonas moolapensis (strain DSM 18674 / CECT 7526 / JCM 14361 / 8.8.11) TaxID=268739 RepID=M1Y4M2_NATM8|nr:hypothetical protein [Natronomonas moolapensis]CCQ37473.1 uncharacterized protein Nmlp_3343 [Natronomonas moolapensis 8.8.11]
MPEIQLSEAQHERFNAVRERLAAEYAGRYASVRPADVVDYLLDTAETDAAAAPSANDDSVPTGPSESTPESTSLSTETATTESVSGSTSDTSGVFDLLDEHADKWRESDGEVPYEVDLPDGSTETARTRDDIKATLFKHYR